MNTLYLITGGNIGDRKRNLEKANHLIEKEIGTIFKSSAIYETEAWGNNDQPPFYNQVHIVKSNFPADQIMNKVLMIEEQMGRIRTIKNAARIIDIDILFFNDETINKPALIVPHPEIGNRRFVLMPLNELAPNLIHPLLHKSIRELLSTCKDTLQATPLTSS